MTIGERVRRLAEEFGPEGPDTLALFRAEVERHLAEVGRDAAERCRRAAEVRAQAAAATGDAAGAKAAREVAEVIALGVELP